MSAVSPQTPRMHPMMWIAAGSVTLFSLAGIGAMLGVLPVQHSTTPASETIKAEQPAPVVAPPAAPVASASAPVVASAEATAEKPAPEAKPAVKPVHKPAASKPQAHHTTAAAPQNNEHAEAPQAAAGGIPTHTPDAAPRTTRVARCDDCGVVESVRAVEQAGEGTGLGAIGGAVLGGVLGHQVGEGTGKQIARIGGAILGGFAGNEAEKRMRSNSHYEITVRMDDGTRRTIKQSNAPAWHSGDKVRVENGVLVSRDESSSSPTML